MSVIAHASSGNDDDYSDDTSNPRRAVAELARSESFVGIVLISAIRGADKLLKTFGVLESSGVHRSCLLVMPCRTASAEAAGFFIYRLWGT